EFVQGVGTMVTKPKTFDTPHNPEEMGQTCQDTLSQSVFPAVLRRDCDPLSDFAGIKTREELLNISDVQFAGLVMLCTIILARFYNRYDRDLSSAVASRTWERLAKYFDPSRSKTGSVIPLASIVAKQCCEREIKANSDGRLPLDEQRCIAQSPEPIAKILRAEEKEIAARQLESMMKCIELLPQSDQIVLKGLLDGLRSREISEQLGISRTAVKMRAFRARKRLRKLVEMN
ncbi:MAG: sigma-70 family RNA polymerase sigma factor, partial [Candidatus Dadabacteria bacterium]